MLVDPCLGRLAFASPRKPTRSPDEEQGPGGFGRPLLAGAPLPHGRNQVRHFLVRLFLLRIFLRYCSHQYLMGFVNY